MNETNEFDAKNWIKNNSKAESLNACELDYVLWFTLIWNRFECIVCDRFATIEKIDKSFEALISSRNFNPDELVPHWDKMANYLRESRATEDLTYFLVSENPDEKNQKQIEKIRAKNEVRINMIKSLLNDQFAESLPKIKSLLFIACRVRNNLFHGEKSIPIIQKQGELFNILNAFLASYADLYRNLVTRFNCAVDDKP